MTITPPPDGPRAAASAPIPDDDGLEHRLAELERIVDLQRQQLAEQEERLATAMAPVPVPASGSSSPDLPGGGAPPPARSVDRRGMLRHAGLAAAGVMGGAALSLGRGEPASAANGDALIGGAFNATTNVTEIGVGTGGSLAGKAAFTVTDGAVLTGDSGAYALSAIAEGNATQAGVFAKGTSTGIHAVATATSGFGLRGEAMGANGVAVAGATSAGPRAIEGVNSSATGIGILAMATGTGTGLQAISFGGSDLTLGASGNPPPTRTDHHFQGELHVDVNGALWFCATTGTPGVWRQVSGADTAGALHLLAPPTRIYDSRPGAVPLDCAKGPFNHQTRAIDAKLNGSGVPVGALAVLLNVTVTNTSSGGFVSVFKNGIPTPITSTVNWGLASSTIANGTVTAVDANALFACYCPSQTDVIIDAIGYYR